MMFAQRKTNTRTGAVQDWSLPWAKARRLGQDHMPTAKAARQMHHRVLEVKPSIVGAMLQRTCVGLRDTVGASFLQPPSAS